MQPRRAPSLIGAFFVERKGRCLPRELDHDDTEGSILNQGDFLYNIPWVNVGFWYTTDSSSHAEDSLVLGTFDTTLDEFEQLEGRDVTVEAIS